MLIPGAEELRTLATALEPTARAAPMEARARLLKGFVGMHGEQLRQASEHFQAGEHIAAAVHAGAAALPGVGPPAAMAAHRAAGSETARGWGNVLGFAAPLAAARYLRTPPTVRGPLRTTRGERSGARATLMTEEVTERTLPAMKVFHRFRKAQQQELIDDMAGDFTNRISTYKGDPVQVGTRIRNLLEESKNFFRDKAGEVYGQIAEEVRPQVVRRRGTREVPSPIVGPRGEPLTTMRPTYRKGFEGGVLIDTTKYRRWANQEYGKLQAQSKVYGPGELQSAMTALRKARWLPRQMPWETFKDARSTALDVARQYDTLPLRGKRSAMADRVSTVLDESMEDALTAAGRQDLARRWRSVNRMYKDLAENFNRTSLKNMLNLPPEKISAYLNTMPFKDISTLRAMIGKEGWDTIRGQFARDMITDAVKGELLPQTGPVAATILQEHTYRRLMGNSLMNKLEKLNRTGRLQRIFHPRESKELIQIAAIAQNIGYQSSILSSILGAGINMKILMGSWEAAGNLLSAPLTAASWASAAEPALLTAGMYGLSKVLTSQAGRGAFLRFMSETARGSAQANFWLNRTLDILAEENFPQDIRQKMEVPVPVPSHAPAQPVRALLPEPPRQLQ